MPDAHLPGVVCRPARADDVPAIFALKREAFGNVSLPYTIYQAEQSCEFFRSRITKDTVVVATAGSVIAGYYHALDIGEAFFLNYIATSPVSRGRGIGSLLLSHFVTTGRALGHSALQLDVFANNRAGVLWYSGAGFEAIRESYLYRVRLADLAERDGLLTVDSELLQGALAEEQRQGFSKVLCKLGAEPIMLGIIAGHTCKWLAPGHPCDRAAAAAVARLFPGRSFLIVQSSTPPGQSLPIAGIDLSIRMQKLLAPETGRSTDPKATHQVKTSR